LRENTQKDGERENTQNIRDVDRRLQFFPERKGHSPANAEKGKHVVPIEPLAQIKECKDHKYAEGDDFLHYLQL
jgi:hypothetical protein